MKADRITAVWRSGGLRGKLNSAFQIKIFAWLAV